MLGQKMIPNFQLLQAIFVVRGASESLNSVYNMVQQQKSQVIAERLFNIEEIL